MKIYIVSALVSFAFSLLFCSIIIPLLKRIKAGQNILVYVKEHQNKSGTPTMGGIAFISAALLSTVIFTKKIDRTVVLCLLIGVSYMIIGLLDDLLKKKHKENLGLRAWQKLFFQITVAIFSGIYCIRSGLTYVYLPFIGTKLKLGFWTFPFAVFVFIATVNAVNLTDGLDGLASAVGVPFFAVLGILIALSGKMTGLSILSFCIMGALLAYLLFNVSPASVFMGDTGSLALGGFAASIALFSGNAFYIPILGVCFVFSVISVIIQVIYYKVTKGKRVFLMAPVHHHFQKKGYSESRIAYAYFILTLIVGIVCVLSII